MWHVISNGTPSRRKPIHNFKVENWFCWISIHRWKMLKEKITCSGTWSGNSEPLKWTITHCLKRLGLFLLVVFSAWSSNRAGPSSSQLGLWLEFVWVWRVQRCRSKWKKREGVNWTPGGKDNGEPPYFSLWCITNAYQMRQQGQNDRACMTGNIALLASLPPRRILTSCWQVIAASVHEL